MWTAVLFIAMLQLHRTLTQLPIKADDGKRGNCWQECSQEKLYPVCGTDSRTYDSLCHLNRAKCEGHRVDVKHRGSCAEGDNCISKRRQIELDGKETVFKPECKEDGSFEEVQCFQNYCWCVDSFGKLIPRSSVKNARPNCFKKLRKTTRRRSSRGKKEKKECGSSDRATMNTNLIEIFRSEYNRFPQPTESDPKEWDTAQKRIIQWKFSQLDLDHDNYLKQDEVRDLKRMVKKIVKPKPCSRILMKFCDPDKDKMISRTEWAVCLGVDLNNENKVNAVEEDTTQDPANTGAKWDHRLKSDVIQDTFSSEDDEPQDCPTRRRKSMELNKQHPQTGAFIPDCTENGLYLQTQCHKRDSGVFFCWCVNPRTGKPIPLTPAMKERPDCETVRRNLRSFKGCSIQKRQVFLSEFLKSLQEEMATSKKEKSSRTYSTIQEQAARWKFDSLDVNNNQLVDKKEWVLFRQHWKIFQQGNQKRRKFKKCWRNLPKFCDEDNDSKVTPQEWMKCVGLQKAHPFNSVKRNGTNPLVILKSDDEEE